MQKSAGDSGGAIPAEHDVLITAHGCELVELIVDLFNRVVVLSGAFDAENAVEDGRKVSGAALTSVRRVSVQARRGARRQA